MNTGPRGVIGRLRGSLGPAWLAGAIAAGPATMASLITAGASYGYALLWVVVLSAIAGSVSQYLAARLGLATDQGIVSLVETHLGERWAWVLVCDAVLAAGLAQLVIMGTLAEVSETITGIDARLWGVGWAVLLALGLASGGYERAELGAKLLVGAIVLVFIATLTVVPIDAGAAASGLVPQVPAGVDGALVAAGVLGGAVHITLVTMHTYTVRARGWNSGDRDLATVDVATSMLVAFGGFSLAIFLVTASVLHAPGIDPGSLTATSAGQALGPLVGPAAESLFLLGLLGAAVSTLGANTIVPPYLLADKFGYGTTIDDSRYQRLLVGTALVSAAGAFLGGAYFQLLVLVLAFGLVGTPFALAVVLYLLNDPDVMGTPVGSGTTLAGVVLLAVATVTALPFVREQALAFDPLVNPIGALAVGFGTVLGAATVAVLLKLVRNDGGADRPTPDVGDR
jgi:manganese transport protein